MIPGWSRAERERQEEYQELKRRVTRLEELIRKP